LFELLKLFVKTAAFYKIKQKKVSKWKFSGMKIKKRISFFYIHMSS